MAFSNSLMSMATDAYSSATLYDYYFTVSVLTELVVLQIKVGCTDSLKFLY